MREVEETPAGIAVHAQLVGFGWAALALVALMFGIYGRVSGAGEEETMWTDVGFFFALVAAVVGLVLGLLALAIRKRSRVAHVITVVLYGIFVLNYLPRFELGSYSWPFLIAIAPAILGLVLLLLPSSRAWCFGPRAVSPSALTTESSPPNGDPK